MDILLTPESIETLTEGPDLDELIERVILGRPAAREYPHHRLCPELLHLVVGKMKFRFKMSASVCTEEYATAMVCTVIFSGDGRVGAMTGTNAPLVAIQAALIALSSGVAPDA